MVLKIRYFFFGIEIVNEELSRTTLGAAFILRCFRASVGRNSVIHSPLIIHNAEKDYSNLHIGANVHVGRNVLLDLTDKIIIKDQAVISMNCSLLTHQDVGNRSLQEQYPRKVVSLNIGKKSYLGVGAIVLAGASIGELAVVGAGAVVLESVSDRTLVVGVPARTVKNVT